MTPIVRREVRARARARVAQSTRSSRGYRRAPGQTPIALEDMILSLHIINASVHISLFTRLELRTSLSRIPRRHLLYTGILLTSSKEVRHRLIHSTKHFMLPTGHTMDSHCMGIALYRILTISVHGNNALSHNAHCKRAGKLSAIFYALDLNVFELPRFSHILMTLGTDRQDFVHSNALRSATLGVHKILPHAHNNRAFRNQWHVHVIRS